MKNQKGISTLIGIVIIIIVAVVTFGGVFAYQYFSTPKSQVQNQQQTTDQQPKPTTCIPNWQCDWGDCKNGYQSQIVVDLNK